MVNKQSRLLAYRLATQTTLTAVKNNIEVKIYCHICTFGTKKCKPCYVINKMKMALERKNQSTAMYFT